MRRPIPSLNMRYLITSLFTVLLLLQHQGKAQPDAYGLSATTSSRKWLTVSQTAGLGAVQNLPVSAAANRYNGQVAQRSQMVRRDDQGNMLFFAVDGRIYDGQGYLIADSKGSGCTQCVDPGIMEMVTVPVPGSCTMFFVLTAVSHTVSTPAYIQYAVLDLAVNNPYHAGRKGGLLEIYGSAFNVAFPSWVTATEASAYVGILPSDPVFAKATSPIIRAVKSGTSASAHVWLYMALTDYLFTYKITAAGIDPIQPISGQFHVPLNNTPSPAITKQFVRDADVFRDGSTVHFAMVDNPVFKPLPSYSTTGDLITMRFNNTTGALISGSVAVYNVGAIGGSGTPSNGGVGGLSGCVFGTAATTIWVGGNYWTGSTWVPRIGTLNTSTGVLTDRSGLIPSLGSYVNSRMYRNIAPNGLSQAIYFPTTSPTSVGVLTGIANPGTAVFNASGIAAPSPVLFIPGTPNVYFPPFLNEGMVGENFVTHFSSATCCIARQDQGGVHGFTVSTSNTLASPWQPGSHPFGGGSTIIFTQDLVVPAGRRLYLKDLTLRFAANAKLVVQQGGYVHTRNTRLTGYDCTNARWPGVRIWGTYTMPQTTDLSPANQGRMELRESSIIENAVVGVQLGADITIPFYILASGGILNTDNSTFRNCQESVRVHPYQNTQVGNPSVLLANRTSFRTTTFTVNANYPAPYDFKHHAYLNLVSGIIFSGCHFKNERSDALFSGTGSLQLGHGIRSLDADFKVLPACGAIVIGACPPQFLLPRSFTGLDHGIHALTATTTRAFEVDKATFTNNICGVYTIGTLGYKVTNNSFTLGNRNVTLNNPDEQYWANHHRAIFSTTSYGFTVDDNTIARQGTRLTEGIVIGYSRDHNDYVFRNTASGMDAAYVGEGVCCDINQKPLVGLQFRCNQNNGNGFNIWNRVLSIPGSAPHNQQTIRTVQGQLNFPAGNTFDRAAGGIPESDLHYNSNLNVVNYIGHATGSVFDPLDIDATYFPKTIVPSAPSNVCTQKIPPPISDDPVELTSGGLLGMLEQERDAVAVLRYVYDNLIDGGSTEALVQEITDTWPAEVWVLRSSLLAKSPYLSTEVLVEAVHKNILPQAVVLEVCVANPEATGKDGFLKWLEYEAPNPLPTYMLGLIEDSWQTKTFRFTLENQLAGRYANMAQAVNALLQVYHADTLYEHVDSLRIAWQELRSPAARYAEAMALVQLNNFAEAAPLIEGIVNEHQLKSEQEAESGRMLQYIDFLQGIQASGRTVGELTATEVDQLENTVALTNDRPGTWARNILCFHYERCVPPPTGWDSGDPKSNRPQPPTVQSGQPTALQVYPNPAATWVTFAYKLEVDHLDAWITLVDAAGRQVARLQVVGSQGQMAWDPRGLASGAYTVELRSGDLLLESTKLVIQ